MAKWSECLVEGNMDCPFLFAVRMARDNYIDLSHIKNLIKSRRQFDIWKWTKGNKYENSPHAIYSGWRKWFSFNKGKWERIRDDNSWLHEGSPMMPAHLLFRTTDEFKEWIGEEQLLKMFSDML